MKTGAGIECQATKAVNSERIPIAPFEIRIVPCV